MNKKKRLKTFKEKQNRLGYLFMTPWIIGFLIFTAGPFLATIYLSFTDVKQTIRGFEISWNNGRNYYAAFLENTNFVPAILSFLQMLIPYTFVIVVVSFILAYLLNKITFLKGFLRTIYFLPVIIMSGPVMTQLLQSTSNADEEVMLEFVDIFIVQMVLSYSIKFAVMLLDIFAQLSIILWYTGIPIILFINGLQKINYSLYEAAQIDSANSWQILWKITIPIIRPIALIVTLFTIVQLGTNPSLGGGDRDIYSMIKTATNNTSGGLGIAATYSWVYSFIILAIMGLVFLLFKPKKEKRRV